MAEQPDDTRIEMSTIQMPDESANNKTKTDVNDSIILLINMISGIKRDIKKSHDDPDRMHRMPNGRKDLISWKENWIVK